MIFCVARATFWTEEGQPPTIHEGRLETTMPLAGTGAVRFSADASSAARINVVKRYLKGRMNDE